MLKIINFEIKIQITIFKRLLAVDYRLLRFNRILIDFNRIYFLGVLSIQ